MQEYIPVAQVLRPQGIDGLVKVRPDTDAPERLKELKHVFLRAGNEYREVSVEDAQARGDFAYLRLDGATTRNQAETQRGQFLYIDRTQTRVLGEDETLICDLIGCSVVDEQGAALGVLKDVLQPGSNDVYVIATQRGELLAPALKRVFVKVDVSARVITADSRALDEVSLYAD